MRKNRKGSTAPQKQQTVEDGFECFTIDAMPRNVKTRSKGLVTSDEDIIKVVRILMEGDVVDKPKWCKNRIDTLSGVAILVDSDIFLKQDKIEMMERLLGGEVAVKAIGDDLWLVTAFWTE